tara:strand:+ start:6254 stop:7168 length:915 start_codon:yes stop_codon:yes gene_type:complete
MNKVNKEYYIGVRSDFNTMGKLLDRPMSRLNQKMAQSLRTTAMRKGIKKTEQGERLEFFVVDKQEMDNLLDDTWRAMQKLSTSAICRPLVKVKADVFSDAINKVNSKPEYQRGMDHNTYSKYEQDLAKSFDNALEVVGTDLNTRKTKPKVADNPFKVGDLIPFHSYGDIWTHQGDNRKESKTYFKYADKRIAKAGKKFVEIEFLQVKDVDRGDWYNTDSAVKFFKDVDAYGLQDDSKYAQIKHGHAIPLESNPDTLEWVLERDAYTGKPIKHQWNRIISGPTREQTREYLDELIPAYCHSYEMR